MPVLNRVAGTQPGTGQSQHVKQRARVCSSHAVEVTALHTREARRPGNGGALAFLGHEQQENVRHTSRRMVDGRRVLARRQLLETLLAMTGVEVWCGGR